MIEAPRDVRAAARKAIAFMDATPSGPNIAAIEAAILAERQRCADVAQKEGEGYRDNGLPQAAIGAFQVRRAILNP